MEHHEIRNTYVVLTYDIVEIGVFGMLQRNLLKYGYFVDSKPYIS